MVLTWNTKNNPRREITNLPLLTNDQNTPESKMTIIPFYTEIH